MDLTEVVRGVHYPRATRSEELTIQKLMVQR